MVLFELADFQPGLNGHSHLASRDQGLVDLAFDVVREIEPIVVRGVLAKDDGQQEDNHGEQEDGASHSGRFFTFSLLYLECLTRGG